MVRDFDGAFVLTQWNPHTGIVLWPPPDEWQADVAATFPEPEGAENSAYLPLQPVGYLSPQAAERLADAFEPIAWKARRF